MKTRITLLVAAFFAVCGLAISGNTVHAAPIPNIGVQFVPGGTALAPTASAGVVPQINYNTLSSYAGVTLSDSNAAPTTAKLTVSSGNFNNPTPASPDQTLNSGLLNNTGTNTFTVTGVPYSSYSLIVYELDNSPRTEGTALGSTVTSNATAVYLESPSPYPGTVSSYTYIRGTGTTAAGSTPNGDYVEFTNLHSGTLTFSVLANGGPGDGGTNMFVNGFQIINNTPEPSSFILCGLGAAGLFFAARRRRRKA